MIVTGGYSKAALERQKRRSYSNELTEATHLPENNQRGYKDCIIVHGFCQAFL